MRLLQLGHGLTDQAPGVELPNRDFDHDRGEEDHPGEGRSPLRHLVPAVDRDAEHEPLEQHDDNDLAWRHDEADEGRRHAQQHRGKAFDRPDEGRHPTAPGQDQRGDLMSPGAGGG